MKEFNNHAIMKVAKKKFFAQRSRNIIACIAIILTTFMLYSILSIGLNYIQNLEKQKERINGTTADVIITNPLNSQIESLKHSGACKYIGIGRQVAVIRDTHISENGIHAANMRYADRIYWEKQIKPVLTNITGHYPKKENEIMLPEWAGKKLGMNTEKTGNHIRISFYYGGTNESKGYGRLSKDIDKEFEISGFYKDNTIDYIRNVATVYVSKNFWKSAPYESEKYKSALYLTLGRKNNISEIEDLIDLNDDQELSNLQLKDRNGLWEVIAIVIVVMICGGLIIYNVIYISIVQDIRFLGHLRTLGMTRRQLKKYLYYQISWLCFIGIPVGVIVAMAVSKGIVPFALNALAPISISKQNITVAFTPIMMIGTVLFSVGTVLLGSLRPLHFVGSLPPIAATKYTNIHLKGKKKCNNLIQLAFRNIFRSRKNAVIVFLSLFLGSILFLITEGVFSGISASALVRQNMRYDFTIRTEYTQGIISEENLRQIADLNGVKEAEVQRMVWVNSDKENSGCWLEVDDPIVENYCEDALNVTPQFREEQERNWKRGNKYLCQIVGIGEQEFNLIAKENHLNINYDEFKTGEIGLWWYQDLNKDEINQEEVSEKSQLIYSDAFRDGKFKIDKMASIPVLQTELVYANFIAPNIIISNEILEKISHNYISEINIITEDSTNDESVFQVLKGIWDDVKGVTIISQKEKINGLQEAFLSTKILGSALSLIMFFIGIMNFINSIYAGVLTRKKELAIMECIGMSKRQIKIMLTSEGMLYMGITCMLILTIGTAIYGIVFKCFSKIVGVVEFLYPWRAFGILFIIMGIMAAVIPLFSYHSISAESALEQLRKVE